MMKIKRSGFSLVELLVAMVVASIGLLGVATLSLQASRYNFDAKLRHQATMLASDMADRIRSNPVNAIVNYPAAVAAAQNNNCDTTACTAAERAEQDVWEWNALLAQLPNGAGTIAAAAPQLTITITWAEIAGDFVDEQVSTTTPVTRTASISVLP